MKMAKMSDGFQSLKQSAGRMGESVKAKTVETRVNMIVNRKLQQPFKALKQTRRVAIQQLAELYKNNKISTSEFDAVALQYETQLVAGANEALRNMVVSFMTDEATKQFDFDSDLIHDVQLTPMTPAKYVKITPNATANALSKQSKRAMVLQAGTMAARQAAKLRKTAAATPKKGNPIVKNAAVDLAVAGVGFAIDLVESQVMARKQFKVSGLLTEYEQVLQQVAEQVEVFKASLQVVDGQLKLLPLAQLIDDDNDEI